MAFQTGTATDYIDLLDIFRDFLTGAGSPTSGLNWVVEREITFSPNEKEMIFRGNGGVSPVDQIYFGIQTYSNSGLGRFNWDLRGMTGFSDGSPEGSVDFLSQPGISPANSYVPLENATMTYWLYGNERRVQMVVKTGTSYQYMYAGFINAFSTEVEWPYPMCVYGSSWNVNQNFNDNTITYAGMPNPGSSSQALFGPCWVRFVDGVWYGFQNFSGTSTETASNAGRVIWPMCPSFSVAAMDGDHSANAVTEGTSARHIFKNQFANITPGGTPLARLLRSFGSPQPTPMFPITVLMALPSRQFLGELDNVFWLSGTGGLTAEDTLLDSGVSPEQQYDVFQNVHRTDDWTLFAIKRE